MLRKLSEFASQSDMSLCVGEIWSLAHSKSVGECSKGILITKKLQKAVLMEFHLCFCSEDFHGRCFWIIWADWYLLGRLRSMISCGVVRKNLGKFCLICYQLNYFLSDISIFSLNFCPKQDFVCSTHSLIIQVIQTRLYYVFTHSWHFN